MRVRELATDVDREALAVSGATPHLRWSPDGATLLISDGERALALPRAGGAPRPIEGVRKIAAWSPEGSRIASASAQGGQLAVTQRSTGETRRFPLSAGITDLMDLDWSPQNNLLSLLTMEQEHQTLWTIRSGGGALRKLIEEPFLIFSPRWSPRGDALYYLRGGKMAQDLVRLPLDPSTGKLAGSPAVVLSGLEAGFKRGGFTLSRDGRHLAYVRERMHSKLWLVAAEQQSLKTTLLTTGTSMLAGSPSVSPDGSTIVFKSGFQHESNIFTQPISGGPTRQLTKGQSILSSPAWSPDGKQIAFGSQEGGRFRVWIVNADGSSPRPFQHTELNADTGQLAWAPGAKILYHRPGGSNFNSLDPITEREEPLLMGESIEQVAHPIYSPAGDKVALQRSAGGLSVIKLIDHSQTPIARGYRPLGWSADGQSIYAAASDGLQSGDVRKIVAFPSAGGEPRRWLELPFATPVVEVSLSGDGLRLVSVVTEHDADVWLVDDFE